MTDQGTGPSATGPSPTPAERAAFHIAQVRAAGDLMCSHDQAWLDAALSEERLRPFLLHAVTVALVNALAEYARLQEQER